VSSEKPVGGALIWNGFDLSWGYNHRLNRLGSLVEHTPCVLEPASGSVQCHGQVTASAASGTGPDTARIQTRATFVASPGVSFRSKAVELVLCGVEDESLTVSKTVLFPREGMPADQTQVASYLQGIDMLAFDNADKLVSFELTLGDARVGADAIEVDLSATVRMSCSSAECPASNGLSYSLLVGVGVAVGTDSALTLAQVQEDVSYSSDTKHEPRLDVGQVTSELPPRQEGARVLAFRSIAVVLDAESHFLGLSSLVPMGDVGGTASLQLGYRNWSHGMNKAHLPESIFAYKQANDVRWQAQVLVLDFREGRARAEAVEPVELYWKGWNAPASAPEARREQYIPLDLRR